MPMFLFWEEDLQSHVHPTLPEGLDAVFSDNLKSALGYWTSRITPEQLKHSFEEYQKHGGDQNTTLLPPSGKGQRYAVCHNNMTHHLTFHTARTEPHRFFLDHSMSHKVNSDSEMGSQLICKVEYTSVWSETDHEYVITYLKFAGGEGADISYLKERLIIVQTKQGIECTFTDGSGQDQELLGACMAKWLLSTSASAQGGTCHSPQEKMTKNCALDTTNGLSNAGKKAESKDMGAYTTMEDIMSHDSGA